MPELPEVETVLKGVAPHLEGATIQDVMIREPRLRWPITPQFRQHLLHQRVGKLSRRGKYLLMPIGRGTVLIHLGMSGALSIVERTVQPEKHDHVDIIFSDTYLLRYRDARRFGCMLWTDEPPLNHTLLARLGPEPLSHEFSADALYERIKHRKTAIKTLIMNSHIVVGVGNIYAAEALFMAKVNPLTPGKNLSTAAIARLVSAIKAVLKAAIKQGGTTVKDFINSEGKPGYFVQSLAVYGRAGLPCVGCNNPLISITLGQRSTVFCEHCQPI